MTGHTPRDPPADACGDNRVVDVLPVDAVLPDLRRQLDAHRAAIVVAAPGTGKSTRVPPALADDGPVLVLQPRRAAARALAARVAQGRGWTLGREVGWHVRFEPRFSADTRVLFATEGMLTARLQQDPFLEDFRTVVLDEFHERSVHADLGLALARQAWLARPGLRLLVMSATLEADSIARFLGACPVVRVPGAAHPLAVSYAPTEPLAEVVDRSLSTSEGNVLVFLPGAREIDETARALTTIASRHDVDVLPLHGALPADEQDRPLTPSLRRRVVLATNIAETSVTVPGVRTVIDSGWQKVARYDAARGIDRLDTERVSADAADQRAGRAARLGPGQVVRLWPEHDRLRPAREPELARVDLSPLVLAIAAWGGRPSTFEWFEAPPADRLHEAMALLARLGALEDERITEVGRVLARLAVSPRLGRLVVEADGEEDACLLAAMLSEARTLTADARTTSSDAFALVEAARQLPHVRRAASALRRAFTESTRTSKNSARARRSTDERLRRAILAGFPDRVARRRAPGSDALRLTSGTGARQSRASGVRDAEWLVALEVRGVEGREASVTLASAIEPEWLAPTETTRRVWLDDNGRLRAGREVRYDALVLSERHDALQPEDHAVLAEAWLASPRREDDVRLLARLTFSGVEIDLRDLAARAALEASSLSDIDIASALPWDIRQRLFTDAPERLSLPSGRTAVLEYDVHGGVRAAVKLQELFGLADTPRIGPKRAPVIFELLAPNGRPVQTTTDLRSFWNGTYAEVRKELRGRYPKHPWPEDPWTATPTHRTTRRA